MKQAKTNIDKQAKAFSDLMKQAFPSPLEQAFKDWRATTKKIKEKQKWIKYKYMAKIMSW